MAELLAMADEETRALWDGLRLGYTETAGHPLLRAEIAALYPGAGGRRRARLRRRAGGDLRLRAGDPGRRRPRRRGHAGLPVAARGGPRRRRRAEPRRAPRARARLGARPRRRAPRAAPRHAAVVVNFPHNPTGAHIDRATLDALVELADEAGAHLFSDEVYRWLERPGVGAAARGGRALRARGEPRRDVEDLRPAGAADRLAGVARSRPARPDRGDQGLHDDLQQRAQRDPRARRPAPARRGDRAQPRDRRRQPRRCSTTSSRAGTAPSSGSARAAPPSASRGCSPTWPSTTSRASSSSARAC